MNFRKYLNRGTLFRCIDGVPCEKSHNHKKGERKIYVTKGEIVEFRCPMGCNFRTVDEYYLYLSVSVFSKHFIPIGKTWDSVAKGKGTSIGEVMRLNLYDRIKL